MLAFHFLIEGLPCSKLVVPGTMGVSGFFVLLQNLQGFSVPIADRVVGFPRVIILVLGIRISSTLARNVLRSHELLLDTQVVVIFCAARHEHYAAEACLRRPLRCLIVASSCAEVRLGLMLIEFEEFSVDGILRWLIPPSVSNCPEPLHFERNVRNKKIQ